MGSPLEDCSLTRHNPLGRPPGHRHFSALAIRYGCGYNVPSKIENWYFFGVVQ
jgi:hypothetical protein